MKEGVWGIGLIIISLITFAVVGTMSNITTTNQQDYEFMKSSVEAAMYDARDEVQYRRGICVCTAKTGSPIKLTDVKDYEILRPNDESECDGIVKGSQKYSPSQCRYLHGEYVVNSDIFTESLISRFGTIAKNQETYDITVQDVVEYPPKTSVKVVYYQYLFEAMGEEHHPIDNQMDAIFEGKEIETKEPSGSATVQVAIKNCDFKEVAGTVSIKNVSTGENTTLSVPAGWKTVPAKFAKVGSYVLMRDGSDDVSYTVDPNDTGDTIQVYVWEKDLKDCPCKDPETPEETPEGDPEETPEDTPEETPETPSTPSGNCKWHYKNTSTTCKSTDPYKTESKSGPIPKCDSPYTVNEKTKNCKSPTGQEVAIDSIYAIFTRIKSLARGKLNCTWTCEKGHSNKTFYSSRSPALSEKAKKSSRGSSESSSAAVTACNNAQTAFCNSQSGYSGYTTNSCKAVRDYKCVGYVRQQNGTNKKQEETLLDQEKNPQSTWCSGKTNCSCSCLG